MHARLEVARRELPRAVRIAVAATLSWWIARLLGADRPVFAVIVPMVAIRDDTHAALSLSLGRMLGVIAGVLLGIAVVAAAGVSTAAIVLLLVIGLAVGLFLRTGPELNTQIAISALLVVIVTKNADDVRGRAHLGDRRGLGRRRWRSPPFSGRPTRCASVERRLAATAEALAADLTAAQGTLTNGEPSARALLAHAEEHARAAGRAVEDLPRSLRALRFSPLRRSSRPRLEIVEQRQRLALRLAIQVRRLARDLASFAHRDDLRDQWEEAARRLPPVIGLVAEAASKALAGEGCSHEVAGRARADGRVTSARTRARSRRSCADRSCCSSTSSRGPPA